MPLLHHLTVRNLLSFGEKGISLPLRPLNVLIGPNGSGKSNLLEVIGLLRAAPRQLAAPVRETGGIHDWLHKGMGTGTPTAEIEALVDNPPGDMPIRHRLAFTEVAHRFELVGERIEDERGSEAGPDPRIHYRFQENRVVLQTGGQRLELNPREIDLDRSILAQRKAPDHYPEITSLAEQLDRIRLYRDWTFGRGAPPRIPQRADDRNDYLDETGANLGLLLNKLRRHPAARGTVLEWLDRLYAGISDFDVIVEGGTIQVFLDEGGVVMPATRLSDGTLRYLCLLAVLCHPNPPPLVCIDEPELGLHPDLQVAVGELLVEASERTQLVVTTHSAAILDVLSDTPEDVVVCEKEGGETVLTRLDAADLAVWKDEYSLGRLWRRGEIGGNRW